VLPAELPIDRLHRLYRTQEIPTAASKSIALRDDLEDELRDVRALGYATNYGESEEGIGSIAVAVHAGGRARAGLAVSGPLSRVNESRKEAIVDALRKTAMEAGKALSRPLQ
jgi:IclR family transcriptional regulator, acetate operon repressor